MLNKVFLFSKALLKPNVLRCLLCVEELVASVYLCVSSVPVVVTLECVGLTSKLDLDRIGDIDDIG